MDFFESDIEDDDEYLSGADGNECQSDSDDGDKYLSRVQQGDMSEFSLYDIAVKAAEDGDKFGTYS